MSQWTPEWHDGTICANSQTTLLKAHQHYQIIISTQTQRLRLNTNNAAEVRYENDLCDPSQLNQMSQAANGICEQCCYYKTNWNLSTRTLYLVYVIQKGSAATANDFFCLHKHPKIGDFNKFLCLLTYVKFAVEFYFSNIISWYWPIHEWRNTDVNKAANKWRHQQETQSSHSLLTAHLTTSP